MLQYVLCENERYSVGEQAQMAVEGGCMWITLHLPGMSDAEIREIVEPDVIELCREASVFLTIDDRPFLARELGLHGVRLSRKFFLDNPSLTPVSLREELGPEAVIGIELVDATALQSLVPADIDFVTLPKGTKSDERINFVKSIENLGIQMPVVAEGNYTIDEAAEAIADGCSGVAISSRIADAHDPVSVMEEYITVLSALK